jgi:hypothetical protein
MIGLHSLGNPSRARVRWIGRLPVAATGQFEYGSDWPPHRAAREEGSSMMRLMRRVGPLVGTVLGLTSAGVAADAPRLDLTTDAVPDLLQDDALAPEGGRISDGTRFYFRIAGWYTMLESDLEYGDPLNGASSILDIEDTLNYDTDLLTLRGEFGFRFADRFHVDFAIDGPFNYDGQSSQSFTFGDRTFDADSESELDAISLEGNFCFDLLQKDNFSLWIGAGVRALLFRFEATGQATDEDGNSLGTETEELEAGAALPVVGLGIRWDLSRNIYLAAEGMGIYAGDYGNAYDVSAEIGWDFVRNFGIFAGYRFSHLEAEVDDVDGFDLDLDGTIHGPYAGIEVRF